MEIDRLTFEANQAQRRIRRLEVRPEDQFLVTTPSTVPPSSAASRCVPCTGALESKLLDGLGKGHWGARGKGRNAEQALSVFLAQRPNASLAFSLDGLPHTDYLPNRAPILDHLRVHLSAAPAWGALRPIAEELAKRRVPWVMDSPSPWEVVIGVTSNEQVLNTAEYLRLKSKETAKKYSFCLLALDTESVTIRGSGEGISREDGKVCLRVAGRGEKGGKSFAVRLMVGHVGWHVQVRLPLLAGKCDRLGNILEFENMELQPGLADLFKAISRVVGVRVEEDVRSFQASLLDIYGSAAPSLAHIKSLELGALARYAGYNAARYSMWILNFYVFGTALAKGEVSCGDGLWHLPWAKIPPPLQAYAYADVAQPAAIAWVLVVSWAIHSFPDAVLLRQATRLSPFGFIKWWFSTLVPRVKNAAVSWYGASSYEQLLGNHPGDKPADLVIRALAPAWPHITAGGPRFLQPVRAFLLESWVLLNRLSPACFQPIEPFQGQLLLFGRKQFRNAPLSGAPVEGLGMTHSPDHGEALAGSQESITFARLSQLRRGHEGVSSRSLMLEYACLYPMRGRELLEVFEASPENRKRFKMCAKMAASTVRDLRVILHALGVNLARPDGWVDPFPVNPAVIETNLRMAGELQEIQEATSTTSSYQANVIRIAAETVREMMPQVLDGSWKPPPLLVKHQVGSKPLPDSVSMLIGRPPPPKRARVSPPSSVTNPPVGAASNRGGGHPSSSSALLEGTTGSEVAPSDMLPLHPDVALEDILSSEDEALDYGEANARDSAVPWVVTPSRRVEYRVATPTFESRSVSFRSPSPDIEWE